MCQRLSSARNVILNTKKLRHTHTKILFAVSQRKTKVSAFVIIQLRNPKGTESSIFGPDNGTNFYSRIPEIENVFIEYFKRRSFRGMDALDVTSRSVTRVVEKKGVNGFFV